MGQLPETRVLEAYNGSSSPPGIQLFQLLIAIQAASFASLGGDLDFDPKYYVDLPLKYPVDTIAEAFASLPRTLPSGTISSGVVSQFSL
jgi:alpha,alpha-trehalase